MIPPAQLLEPQPTPTGGQQSVTDWLVQHCPAELAPLFECRREQGRAHYGAELQTDNGRNARYDAIQEAVDLCVYLAQEHMETPTLTSRAALDRALELLAVLVVP